MTGADAGTRIGSQQTVEVVGVEVDTFEVVVLADRHGDGHDLDSVSLRERVG